MGGTQKLEVAVRFNGFGFIPFFGGGGSVDDDVEVVVAYVDDMETHVVDGDRERFLDLESSIGEDVEGVAEEALLDGEHTLSVGLGVLTLCAVFGESVPNRLNVEKSVLGCVIGGGADRNDGISCGMSFSSFT